jgi:hypothetical protein
VGRPNGRSLEGSVIAANTGEWLPLIIVYGVPGVLIILGIILFIVSLLNCLR